MENGGRKILVVDDDRTLTKIVTQLLEYHQYQVSTAHDGNTAIKQVLAGPPELILLDLNLPDFSGEEVLRRVKEIDENIAIVIVTGFGGEQIAVALMKAGASDYISKPFEREALLGAIENALKVRDAQISGKQLKSFPSLEKFFPFLAHEIRNPLHAISGALAVIERRSDLNDQFLAKSIKIIQEEVNHLNDFVQECLNFVRPLTENHLVKIDVNEIIRMVINIVSHMFHQYLPTIKIKTSLDPKLPKVDANYEEMKRAFVNIVKNAFEAMPNGGELIIKTGIKSSSATECVEIVFSDSGYGIKKENMKYLYQPFSTTKRKGTGLGLAISRRVIVERHHGEIHIRSEEGKGTTVTVTLPVIKTANIS